MDSPQERDLNRAAYGQLSAFIDQTYAPGRFVAISGGKIVADAAHVEELQGLLNHMGKHSDEVLVVQAGVEYPETVVIFSQILQP